MRPSKRLMKGDTIRIYYHAPSMPRWYAIKAWEALSGIVGNTDELRTPEGYLKAVNHFEGYFRTAIKDKKK